MNHRKRLITFGLIIAGIIIILGILWFSLEQKPKLTPNELEAEKIILTYIEKRNLRITPYTKEYSLFMKEILLDGYPELTGNNAIYGNDPIMREAIISYAGKFLDNKYKQPEGAADPKPVNTLAAQPTE